ncbi:GNAT family N-acetyltransferase [Streptomyces sp. NPDC047525]|uniref:GNAT family N-acetyltransferase n=1 Tax=Streptomyces sp. NPDC047525 TaxID=3155264 RepID=UPI0033D30D4F
MSKSICIATGTIRLQGIGRVPVVEAQELTVGDTLMWNEGTTTIVRAIVDASPKFLLVTEKSKLTGEEHDRRPMKTRLVARAGTAASPAETATVPEQSESTQGKTTAPAVELPAGRPSFDTPNSAEDALRNLAALLDGKPEVWPHGDVEDVCVACYGPLYRWDSVAELYRFRGRRGAESREAYPAALTAARALTDGVLALLGTEKPTRADVHAALNRIIAAVQFPAGSAVAYVPAGETKRVVVLVNSGPADDGTVEVLSIAQGGQPLCVPLANLEQLPELPPAPEGEITDWWTVVDAKGVELVRVQADDDPGARKAAMGDAAVAAACRRRNGFAVRRLRTSELSVPVGELCAPPRVSPAEPAGEDAYTLTRQTDEEANESWLLLHDGDLLIGFADIIDRGFELWLAEIAVHPDYRGRGLASRLLDAVVVENSGHAIALACDASPVDDLAEWPSEVAGLPTRLLAAWYDRHGFRPAPNEEAEARMVRVP